jgi:hypothetical protein
MRVGSQVPILFLKSKQKKVPILANVPIGAFLNFLTQKILDSDFFLYFCTAFPLMEGLQKKPM